MKDMKGLRWAFNSSAVLHPSERILIYNTVSVAAKWSRHGISSLAALLYITLTKAW
jgi:hypothetical protein